MLTETSPGHFSAGTADFVCILQLPAGTFHVAFFEEHPLPGPVQPISDLAFVRVKSKMHHTTGAPTLEGAQAHLDGLREQIELPDANVVRDEAIPVDDPVSNWLVPNWTRSGDRSLKECLRVLN